LGGGFQVINAIQAGPYKNIYNPENFFVGKQGIGAGNNWAAGYATGESVQEEVFDMIDREADGSDSLEVRHSFLSHPFLSAGNLTCRDLCFCIQLPVVLALVLGVTSWNE
jgi:hypothetical protein